MQPAFLARRELRSGGQTDHPALIREYRRHSLKLPQLHITGYSGVGGEAGRGITEGIFEATVQEGIDLPPVIHLSLDALTGGLPSREDDEDTAPQELR